MNPFSRAILPVVIAAATVGIAPVATAQPEPTRAGMSQGPKLINISFPGGTMAEYVDAVCQAVAPEPLNVLLRDEASTLPVPQIRLRSVSVQTAFEIAVPDRGRWTERHADGSLVERVLDLNRIGDTSSAPVFVIDARTTRKLEAAGVSEPASPPVQIEVFSVEEAAPTEQDVRDLLSAIDTALALGGASSQAAEVKYHADSSLLIIRGTRAQIGTIDSVLTRFQESRYSRTIEVQKRETQRVELKAQIIERRADVRREEVKLQLAIDELGQLERLAGGEMVSDRAIREKEAEVRMTESDLEAARARLEAVETKMKLIIHSTADFETRTFRVKGVSLKVSQAVELLQGIDSISDHINGVRPKIDYKDPKNDPSSSGVIEVSADEEGLRIAEKALRAFDWVMLESVD